nr:MAG TPA: protein of unknown function (DUF5320) [Caudoviricetes sp.]
MICPDRSIFPREPSVTDLHIRRLMEQRQALEEQMEELAEKMGRIDLWLEEMGIQM